VGFSLSAFAVVYERSNTPADPGVLERVMERLKHRGPDGSDVILAGHVALGHWRFWTTPEDVNERQPLKLDGLPYTIVFDGRLDNRPDLLAQLGMISSDEALLSDAALVLHAYARWGADCLEYFIGEFALAVFDEHCSELFCARDALGDRTLFYSIIGARFVLASEPWAVAGADTSALQLNETAVAHYFALKVIEDGQTLFKNVYELMPAHGMIINASGQRSWRYWQPDLSVRLSGRSDKEYAEQFILLLEESVRCRLRSATPAGVLMSGGLDSGSVACLAARMMAPGQLTTISYVFDELTDCDERKYIETVRKQWNTRSLQFTGDDTWPLKDWQNWPHNPNLPEGNPYRLLKERAYQKAHEAGLRVLITGIYGDQLYSASADWLADLIMEGKLLTAAREVYLHFHHVSPSWNLQAGYLQRAARRLVNILPGGRHLHRRQHPPSWLTPFSVAALSKIEGSPNPAVENRNGLLGTRNAWDSSAEIFNANRHTLDLRHPYRDRRLVEFVLSLPSYQLYKRGLYKYILRFGMYGILPEPIRTRYYPTQFYSLLRRGFEREKSVMQACVHAPNAAWRMFVSADWLLKHWEDPVTAEADGASAMVPWLCIAYESWLQSSDL
jgi:asparagine synthase (glutamine-hydrolysing)